MKLNIALLLLAILALNGCGSKLQSRNEPQGNGGASYSQPTAKEQTVASSNTNTTTATEAAADQDRSALKSADYKKTSSAQPQVSLEKTDAAKSAETAIERKIIRNANLTLESNAPADGQRRIASIAEAHGGFVVTSESSQRADNDQTKPLMSVTVVARVPAAEFNAALEEIRGVGTGVRQEKITGQDVTEEYIDLEARIRTKKALEAQFLEIMKQARSVSDALEVQSQLAEVRGEIERLEGRRRYLENQSSLSTITVTLQAPTPLVNTTGFFYNVKRAFGDGVDIAAAITLFIIQLAIALVPVALLIFLPLGLLARFLLRRARRLRLAKELAREPQTAAETR
jgi:murein DD-endopeptidase MepM/ murein hydrolase activator NlpD